MIAIGSDDLLAVGRNPMDNFAWPRFRSEDANEFGDEDEAFLNVPLLGLSQRSGHAFAFVAASNWNTLMIAVKDLWHRT
jgi:hypothetical protein